MESYWSIIIISNILFFSCMLWMGQTNGKVFLGLLELSNKRGVVILNLEKRLKEIEKVFGELLDWRWPYDYSKEIRYIISNG